MTSQRIDFDNTNSAGGIVIHFTNIQAEDMFLVDPVYDTQNKTYNSEVYLIFQQKYRKISIFATEMTYHEIQGVSLGNVGKVQLDLSGELISGISLVTTLPAITVNQQSTNLRYNDPADFADYTDRKTIKQFGYITNLGLSIADALLFIESVAVDLNKSFQNQVLQNIFRRIDQRHYLNRLQGNTLENCELSEKKDQFKIVTPFKFFLSDQVQKAFNSIKAGKPVLYLNLKFKNFSELICYTRNLKDDITLQQQKPTRLGVLVNQVFLSEQERKLQLDFNAVNLFEQNLYVQKSADTNKTQKIDLVQFMHPTKFIYWAIQKNKFMNKSAYLSYKPTIEGQCDKQALLEEATIRFVQKFATYSGAANYTGIAGYTGNLGTATAALTDAQLQLMIPFLKPNADSRLSITFKTNADSLILSVFDSNGLGLTEQNATDAINIQNIFKRIQPMAITFNDVQRFAKQGSVYNQGGLLTIQEASERFDRGQASETDSGLKSHLPTVIPYVGRDCAGQVANFDFSLYSNQRISLKYGDEQQFTSQYITSSAIQGNQLFSDVVQDSKFNYGLDDFDVIVQQYDNYGKYLDQSGYTVQTSELLVGGVSRFKLGGFYTENLHQMNNIPGKSPNGVNLYSFALNPELIQPTGQLNLSRIQNSLMLECDTEQNDQIIVAAQVYNVIDYQQQTASIMYQTNLQI